MTGELLSAVIDEWISKVRAQNRQFIVFHIPWSTEWKKESELQDSRKPYLIKIAEKQEIEIIDPTNYFRLYDDYRRRSVFRSSDR